MNKNIYEEKPKEILYYIVYEEYYKRYRFRKSVNNEKKNLNKNDRQMLIRKFLKKYLNKLNQKFAYGDIRNRTIFNIYIKPPAHKPPRKPSFSFDFKEILTLHKLIKKLYKIQNEDSGNFKHYASNTDFVKEILNDSKYIFLRI